MRFTKVTRLVAVASGSAALILGVSVAGSSAAAAPTVTAAHTSPTAIARLSMTPDEKGVLTFSGYSYADTSAGRAAAEAKLAALVAAGWGPWGSIVLGDPDSDRWCVWIYIYL